MYANKLNTATQLAAFGWCFCIFTVGHVLPQLLRLPGTHMSEEEGAEGQDGLARLPGEV